MASIGDLLLKVSADLKQFETDLTKKATAVGDKAGQSIGQRMGRGLDTRAFTAFGASVGLAVAGASESFVKLEDQLRTIQTIAPDIDLSKLEDDIQSLSRETGKTTEDLASGFYDLVSSGVAAEDAMAVLKDSAVFATGALGTTNEAVNLITSALGAYGLEASESTRVADIFAQTVADGATTASELGSSLSVVAPIAANLGISLEELGAGAARMTVTGDTASVAFTKMKGAINALLTPNKSLLDIQERTGKNFADIAKEKGLVEALEELRQATNGNNEEFAKALGSTEALGFAMVNTGENVDAYRAELEKVTKAAEEGGVAQSQYEIKSQSLAEQGKRLAQTFVTLGQEVGETVGPFGQLLFAVNQIGPTFGGIISSGKALGGVLGGLAGKLLGPKLTSQFQGLGGKLAGGVVAGFKGGAGKLAGVLASVIDRIAPKVDVLTDAVASGLDSMPGSSKVKAAIGRARKFLSSSLGKGLAITVSVVAVVELVETYNQVKGEIERQSKDIAKQTAGYLEKATTEELINARKGVAEQLAAAGNDPVAEFLGLSAAPAIRDTIAQLDAEIARRAGEIPKNAGDAMASNASYMKDAAKDAITTPVVQALAETAIKARIAAGEIPGEIAGGIRDKRSAVDQALEQLKTDMENSMRPSEEKVKLIGVLTSKLLADGLKHGDPVVRAQAQETKRVATERLLELVGSSGTVGKKAMEELARAAKSKNPEVRAAAAEVRRTIERNLKPNTKPAGEAAITDFIKGMNAKAAAAVARALAIANRISSILGVNIPVPNVPGKATGGHVSAFTPYVVGERRPELFVPSTAGRIYPTVASGLDALGVGQGGDTYNLQVVARDPARTPADIVAELRRNARLGYIGSRRETLTTRG